MTGIHDRQLLTHLLVVCDLEKHARNYPYPRSRSLVVVANQAPVKKKVVLETIDRVVRTESRKHSDFRLQF